YGNYLGLDGPGLASRYKRETAGQAESSPHVGPPPEPEGPRLRFGWTVFVLLIAGLFVYGVYQLSESAPANRRPTTESAARTLERASARRSGSGYGSSMRGAPSANTLLPQSRVSPQTAASATGAPAAFPAPADAQHPPL